MIVQRDFLNKLKEFGLNGYESKIWTALLSRGVSTAGELSDIADVPRSRSYDVLESLEKKGFIIKKMGKPIKYIAIKPEEAIERIKKKIEEETKLRLELIESLKSADVFEELNLMHNRGLASIKASDLSGAITNRRNIYNHLISMIKNSKKSITLFTTSEGIIRKKDIMLRYLKKAKERGVKIRIAAPIDNKAKRELSELYRIAEIKKTNIRARFCIIDGEEILIMPIDDEKIHPSYDVGVWINTPFFARALEGAIDSYLKR